MSDIIARGMAAKTAKFSNYDGYNIENGLRNFRAALANVDRAPVNIVCIGDSMTYGFHSSDYHTKGWVARLRTLLQSKYGNTGEGFLPLPVPTGTPTDNNPWTFDANWTQKTSVGGLIAEFYEADVAAAVASLTFTGTEIDVIYATNNSGATTSTVTIDGVAQTAINFNAVSLTWGKVQKYTGLSAGSHTLQITSAAGKSWIEGAVAYNSVSGPPNGCSVHRVGRGSLNAQDILSGSAGLPEITAVWSSIHLAIVAYGINDANPTHNISTASYINSMSTIISTLQNNGSSVLLLAFNTGNISGQWLTNYQANLQAEYQLADKYNCALVDINMRWSGNWNTAQSLNMMSDTAFDGNPGSDQWHPSDLGHRDIANAIARHLIGQTT